MCQRLIVRESWRSGALYGWSRIEWTRQVRVLAVEPHPSFVIFLTDGLPTVGETSEGKIGARPRNTTGRRADHQLRVGYDVNSRLLDRLSRENFGQSEYVRPDEDIEDRVGRLYGRIESPVMTGVEIEFSLDEMKAEEGSPVNRVYPKDALDLFAGEQLVVVGRYKKSGAAKVIVQGTVGGKKQKFDFPANLTQKSPDETCGFIEKLWAVRRVGEIIDELDLGGKNQELIQELVTLSTRHGILTPYTSFMADENTNLHDVAANAARADVRLEALQMTEGRGGFVQRAMKSDLKQARVASSAPMMQPAADAADALGLGPSGSTGQPMAGGGFGGSAQDAGSYRYGVDRARASRQLGSNSGAAAGGQSEPAGEAQLAQQNVRNIANRTFYQREGRWIDSQVSKEQETKATRVQQFSDEYFALAKRFGKTMSQYMVFEEPVLLNLEDRTYLIEP